MNVKVRNYTLLPVSYSTYATVLKKEFHPRNINIMFDEDICISPEANLEIFIKNLISSEKIASTDDNIISIENKVVSKIKELQEKNLIFSKDNFIDKGLDYCYIKKEPFFEHY